MLYIPADFRAMFRNKHVVVMGDSVQRCLYKDLVAAINGRPLTDPQSLKAKCETSYLGDCLVYRSQLSNGREFTEVREFQSEDNQYLIQYYFLTRCYNERMELILDEFVREPPDIVIMNSCLWDISRYGESGESKYYENMKILCTRMREVLPKSSMFLWTTTMPVASDIAAGFLLETINFLSDTLRLCLLEANYYVSQIIINYGFDVLDLHFYLRCLINHRLQDGVHWDSFATRHISELILTFLYDAWRLPLPPASIERMKHTDIRLDLQHYTYHGNPGFLTSNDKFIDNEQRDE